MSNQENTYLSATEIARIRALLEAGQLPTEIRGIIIQAYADSNGETGGFGVHNLADLLVGLPLGATQYELLSDLVADLAAE